MRITALRGSAEAAASALAAVRTAVERQQRALDAALARRAEAEEVLAGVDPDARARRVGGRVTRPRTSGRSATRPRPRPTVSALRERLHAAERERRGAHGADRRARPGARRQERRLGAGRARARGVRGLVGDAVKVTAGYEAAIAAVLGPLAEGVLVDDRASAFAVARRRHATASSGVVDIVIAEAGMMRPAFPDAARRRARARGGDRARGRARPPVARGRRRRPRGRARSRSRAGGRRTRRPGDDRHPRAARSSRSTRSAPVPAQGRSRLELAAERDAAAERRDEITVVADSLREALGDATRELESARQRTKTTLATLREHDAALAAHAEQVNRATVRHEAAVAECERLAAGVAQAAAAVEEAEGSARSAEDQLTAALEAPRPILDASAREGMLAALEAARDAEMRARLDVETLRERIRAGEARVVAARTPARARARGRRRGGATRRRPPRAARDRRRRRGAAARRARLRRPLGVAGAGGARRGRVRAHGGDRRARRSCAPRRARCASAWRGSPRASTAWSCRSTRSACTSPACSSGSQSELGLDEDILISEYGPDQPVPVAASGSRPADVDAAMRDDGDDAGAHRSLRPRAAAPATAGGRAQAHAAGTRESARTGGVRGARAAAQVPDRAARRPHADPQGPDHDHRGARRADAGRSSSPRSKTRRSRSARCSRCCSPAGPGASR